MRGLAILAVAACASPARIGPRFVNAPAVTIVDDRRDVPTPPQARDGDLWLYYFDESFVRQMTRALELPRPQRALGVNALDEVPDSTWFTNRVGVREVSPTELARGPCVIDSPELHKPWTVLSSKVGGASVGFVIRDARGEKFLIKFDPAGYPEAETATDIITNRLLWGFGYNVPEDRIVHLRRTDLVLTPASTTRDDVGRKRRLEEAELGRQLAKIEVGADGVIRALASRIVKGTWLGGHPGTGVRPDDPNDRIAHELRRDLRGQYAAFAWLDSVDIKEQNTLDMWVADRDDPKHHYVKHYLIDFGKSLGFMAATKQDPQIGFAYFLDYGDMLGALLSVGIRRGPWEDRVDPRLPGLGAIDGSSFDPGRWKPATQVYLPLRTADRFDGFWASKIIARFTREQLTAVVAAAQLSDPRAAAYLVDTLIARQRATVEYWFGKVNPIDRPAVEPFGPGHALCFTDLALEYRLAQPLSTSYTLTRFDRAGRRLGAIAVDPGATARTCPPLFVGDADDGYTIVEIAVSRPGFSGKTLVHVARDPISRAPRVIGIWRP